MKIPRPSPPKPSLAAVPAVASMLAAIPAISQARDTTITAVSKAADSTAAGTFNGAFDSAEITRLLFIVFCGALGAIAADLVADGGRLERWKKDGDGWTLGFLGKLIVGSIAAVIVLSLNPPTNWWQLIGTALTAGVGAEAILLAIIASRKAAEAEKDLEHAEANARGITALAQERLATLKATASAEAGGGRMVPLLADRFSVELATFAAAVSGGSIRQRVRTILVRQLGHEDVDSRPLGEIGGQDAGVRRLIARDIRLAFPGLRWGDDDVKTSSTLQSLANEIDLRLPLDAAALDAAAFSAPSSERELAPALEATPAAGGSIRQRIRAILVERLGHGDVDTRPLGEIGGQDPEVRRQIARDIRLTFPGMNPPWTDGDVTTSSTLRSLADDVDRRLPLDAGAAEAGAFSAPSGERAVAATLDFAPAVGGSIRQRVRGILVGHLGHDDVDSRPLGEIGGQDAGVRRLIARDIRLAFPGMNPPWSDSDVTTSSTLRSLSDAIDLRSPVA